MSLKEQGVTLWVNEGELKEMTSLSYSITRDGPPAFQMGSPDPRSFSRGRSLPPRIEISLEHIAKLGDKFPYTHMQAQFYGSAFLKESEDVMRVQIVKDGKIGTLIVENLILTDYQAKHVEGKPDHFEWATRFEGHVKEQSSTLDPETATNEQLLSRLRDFEDDVWEMKL